jgi:hypothetical protein
MIYYVLRITSESLSALVETAKASRLANASYLFRNSQDLRSASLHHASETLQIRTQTLTSTQPPSTGMGIL